MARKKKLGSSGFGHDKAMGTGHATLPGHADKRKLLPLQGHDSIAHPSHHQANVDHGTPMGFQPDEGYKDGGCDHHMGDNVAFED